MQLFGQLISAAAMGLLVAPAGGNAQSVEAPRVQVRDGWIAGVDKGGYRLFQGIPFAAAPSGALRWRAPARTKAWKGVRDASKPGPKCPQMPMFSPGEISTEEDCLYLNVTTPSGGRQRKPVMVWVHGGGFSSGSGAMYGAQRLATLGDVVVVTVNYRLGVFGLFSHPSLTDPGPFALQDQLASLRWVRANAAAFGGDPANVTLFGESAGGMSVCALMTSPQAKGLFDKAIIQSGSCHLRWPKTLWLSEKLPRVSPYTPRETVDRTGVALERKLGCEGKGLDCLRKVPVADLLKATVGQPDTSFGQLLYGGATLPIAPAEAMEQGRFIRVPTISGGTKDEGRLAAALRETQAHVTPERYLAMLRLAFDDRAPLVAKLYPASDYPSPALAWGAVATDSPWSCPTLTNNRQLAKYVPVWAYEFADRDAKILGFPSPPAAPLGAVHGGELGYLFDFDLGEDLNLAPASRALGDQMIRYWAAFAATGNPNRSGLPNWPRFGADEPVLSLTPGPNGIRPIDFAAEHHCIFWADPAWD